MKYFKFKFDYKFLKLFQDIIPLTKYMHFAFTFKRFSNFNQIIRAAGIFLLNDLNLCIFVCMFCMLKV